MTSAGGTPSRSLPFSTLTHCSSTLAGPPRPGFSSQTPGPDELLKVLVARDDDDVHARLDALPRERADHVVGFIALQ